MLSGFHHESLENLDDGSIEAILDVMRRIRCGVLFGVVSTPAEPIPNQAKLFAVERQSHPETGENSMFASDLSGHEELMPG